MGTRTSLFHGVFVHWVTVGSPSRAEALRCFIVTEVMWEIRAVLAGNQTGARQGVFPQPRSFFKGAGKLAVQIGLSSFWYRGDEMDLSRFCLLVLITVRWDVSCGFLKHRVRLLCLWYSCIWKWIQNKVVLQGLYKSVLVMSKVLLYWEWPPRWIICYFM